MKTHLISLRNPARILMHAAIRTAASSDTTCAEARDAYLSIMPPPFNSYEVLFASSLHNDDNWQYELAFGPFTALLTVELMTAPPTSA